DIRIGSPVCAIIPVDHLDPLRDRDGGNRNWSRMARAVRFAPPSTLPHEYAGAIFMAVALNRGRARQGRQALPGPVGLIGAGKVGTALAALLHARGVEVVAVSGRTLEDSRRMAISAGLSTRTALS